MQQSTASLPARDPPSHPDHARLQWIREGVRMSDAQVGQAYDEHSERPSRALPAAGKDRGDIANIPPDTAAAALARMDRIALGTDGRYLFAVQASAHGAGDRFAVVLVETALRTPAEQSDARLEEANARIARPHDVSHAHAMAPNASIVPRAPAMSMH